MTVEVDADEADGAMRDGGGRDGRRRTSLVGGAALLALVAITVVVVGRSGGGPAEVWRTPATDSDVAGEVDLALWRSGSVLTRVAPTHVTGFDAAGGDRLWEADEPAETRGICAASERTNDDGVGAVLYTVDGDDERCARLGVLDTHNGGELLWSTDLGDDAAESGGWWGTGDESTVTVTASTVSVSNVAFTGLQGFLRFDLATGEEAPALDLPDRDCPVDLAPYTLVGQQDARVVAATSCEPAPRQGEVRAWTSVFDADSGELLWTREHPRREPVLAVVSGEPLILSEGLRAVSPATGELEGSRLVAYSDAGEVLWRRDREDVGGGPSRVRAVTDDAMVVETLTHEGGPSGAFAGYDVASGERLWRSRVPQAPEFLGAAGDAGPLLFGAYALHGDDDGRMTLTWLDPADGATREFGTVPFPLESIDPRARVAFDADRLYLTGHVEPAFRLRAFAR